MARVNVPKVRYHPYKVMMEVQFLLHPCNYGDVNNVPPADRVISLYRKVVSDYSSKKDKTMDEPVDFENLIEQAREAQSRAHAPYSDYHVGASLLTDDGEVYTACNIEAKPSANTLHAEQRAIAKAVEDGHNEFIALGLVTGGDAPLPPCGNCRQSLATFQEDLLIAIESDDGIEMFKLDFLLPEAYTGRSQEDAPTEG